jgi:hypothetical protein
MDMPGKLCKRDAVQFMARQPLHVTVRTSKRAFSRRSLSTVAAFGRKSPYQQMTREGDVDLTVGIRYFTDCLNLFESLPIIPKF